MALEGRLHHNRNALPQAVRLSAQLAGSQNADVRRPRVE
jgi:hypothetical protein